MKTIGIEGQRFGIPDWVSWLAQDEDGSWWGYEDRPVYNRHGTGWVSRHGFVSLLLQCDEAADWKTTLRKV